MMKQWCVPRRDIRRNKPFFFEEQKTVYAVCITSLELQPSTILDNVYVKSVVLEGELPLAEMQAAIGNNYGKLQSAFNNFQNILKKTCQQQQQQKVSAKTKQLTTITDMLSRTSSSK